MNLDFLHYEFMRYGLVSACLLGPVCALLGVFITLRGMAFFSDAIAHSAITGLALGYLLQEWLGVPVNVMVVVLIFSLLLSSGMAFFFQRTTLRADTIIAFSFTGSVALGVAIISHLGKYRLLEGMLFGDIYANSLADLGWQAGLVVLIFGLFFWQRQTLTLAMVQPELARVQGVKMAWLDYGFGWLIALTITVCLKMLGALLLSGLIVIPAAAAKLVARNFQAMIVIAVVFGLTTACSGVVLSYYADLPTGPTIVMLNVAVLLGCLGVGRLRGSR